LAREPARIELANLPTRGHALRTGDDLGVPLWIKRDDHTGGELSGNKVRKLEYLMAEAVLQNATHVLTCGGEQSNHARATAFAAARLGLRSTLILRCDDPAHPPATTGNILLDRLAGAELRWITRAAWRDRNELLAAEARRVRDEGGLPYVIPEGGSNALGSWGYIRAAHELVTDLAAVPKPCTVVYACGSGGTAAGLILGGKLFGLAAAGIRLTARTSWPRSCGSAPRRRTAGSSARTSPRPTSTSSTATSARGTRAAGPRSWRRSLRSAVATASCSTRSTPARRSTRWRPS
jgi:D-cysteine desulfhydrase